jgi:hypothetical protein
MPGRHQRALLRYSGAAAVVAPVVLAATVGSEQLLVASLAATVAIAVHRPGRYCRIWRRIWFSYLATLAMVVPISFVGAALGVPVTVTAGVLVVAVAAGRAARLHPPVAGLPLAVHTTIAWHSLALWALVFLAVAYVVLALRIYCGVARRPTTRPHVQRSPAP